GPRPRWCNEDDNEEGRAWVTSRVRAEREARRRPTRLERSRETEDKRKGRPSAAHLRNARTTLRRPKRPIWTARSARLTHSGKHAMCRGLTCHEFRAPDKTAMERLVESAVVGADRKEPDDDDPKRDAEHQSDCEGFHLVLSLARTRSCGSASEQPACHGHR